MTYEDGVAAGMERAARLIEPVGEWCDSDLDLVAFEALKSAAAKIRAANGPRNIIDNEHGLSNASWSTLPGATGP